MISNFNLGRRQLRTRLFEVQSKPAKKQPTKSTQKLNTSYKKTRMSFSASSSEDMDIDIPWFDNTESELFLRSVPKVELHVHFDGSFSPKELWDHLQRNPGLIQCIPIEQKLPWETNPNALPFKLRELVSSCKTDLDYTRLCTCRRRYRKTRHAEESKKALQKKTGTLEDMLLCFQFFLPLVHNNFDLLENLAFDFVKRQKEQNVIYTEVRYSPHLLANDPHKAHQAITKGLRRGCIELSTVGEVCIVNQILCGIDFQPEWSADVIDMAHKLRQDFPCAVVGVDIAAGESHFVPDSPFHDAHLDMCRKAGELGIPVTLHAGETPDSEQNVGAAIRHYGAKRIGHGYRISMQDDVIELAKSKNIHFENCPTSSVETGAWIKTEWSDHPTITLREKGVKVSISSDDPAVFNTSLTWQWRIAMKKMGWEMNDVFDVLEDTIDAAFAPEEQKIQLRQAIQKYKASPDLQQNPQFNDRVQHDKK